MKRCMAGLAGAALAFAQPQAWAQNPDWRDNARRVRPALSEGGWRGGGYRSAPGASYLRNGEGQGYDASRRAQSGMGYEGYGRAPYATGGYGQGYPPPYPLNPRPSLIRPNTAQTWRRGQVLPQDYRGADVADPGRYHLRSAPNGYGWVGDGRNAYLMQRSTGMVLDAVPGAYDPEPPPPPNRRYRR